MKKNFRILLIILILAVVVLVLMPSKKSSNGVSVVDVKSQLVMGMRQRGSYKDVGTVIGRLYQFAAEKGIAITGAPIFVCHETTPDQVIKADKEGSADLEVVVSVTQKLEDTNEVKFYELAGGKMARILHQGSYDSTSSSYGKLFTWIGQNSKKIIGLTREVYLNDPAQVKPADLLTEIYAPIE